MRSWKVDAEARTATVSEKTEEARTSQVEHINWQRQFCPPKLEKAANFNTGISLRLKFPICIVRKLFHRNKAELRSWF